jgi:hypothetical protein
MAQANPDNSTPMPVDPTRRRFLATAAVAGAAAATLSAGAALASADASDPIYAAIERHKQTAAVWGAAADVRSHFNDLHMTAEQRDQRDELDDALDGARALCDQAGIELINTAPTTLAGIVAAIGYIRIQMRDDGTFMPHHLVLDTGGDAQETMGWIDAFLATIANAAAPGKAVA